MSDLSASPKFRIRLDRIRLKFGVLLSGIEWYSLPEEEFGQLVKGIMNDLRES
jgi:hypothetical protein